MTAPVPPVDLDQLAATLAAATPGPWIQFAWSNLSIFSEPYMRSLEASEPEDERPPFAHISASKPEDAAAIVAAVNAAPALIAELRDLRAKQDAVQALAVRMRAQGEPYLNEFDRGLVAGYRDAADRIDRALDGS